MFALEMRPTATAEEGRWLTLSLAVMVVVAGGEALLKSLETRSLARAKQLSTSTLKPASAAVCHSAYL